MTLLRSRNRFAIWFLALASLVIVPESTEAQETVFVNGERVVQDDFVRELGRFGIPMTIQVPDGDYWYDRMSGLWGIQGGPALGQMPAMLDLGGALRRDASTGQTGIVVNGREVHRTEAAYLQQLFGYVIPGRYWMNAMGVGGFEGGPAIFDVAAAARQQGGGGGYTRRGPFGSMGSDGECSYFMTPGGASVMTGRC